MNIVVGSKNPVKIEAVKLAFQAVWPEKEVSVEGVEVSSGVSAQPMSIGESIKGARNRAKAAMKQKPADYAVGLEGGIFKEENEYFDGGWIVVIDKQGRECIGATVQIPVPDSMMKLIYEGKELGEVCDILFKEKNSKQAGGHFGLMTKNLITRSSGYRDGVIMALTRFIHPRLFE